MTLKENTSVLVEIVQNQTLQNVLKGHIGDFDSLGYMPIKRSVSLNRQKSSINNNNKKDRSNSNNKQPQHNNLELLQMKLINNYVDLIKYCFRSLYDKSFVDVKSDLFEVNIDLNEIQPSCSSSSISSVTKTSFLDL